MPTLEEAAKNHCKVNDFSTLYVSQIKRRCERFTAWNGNTIAVERLIENPEPLSEFLTHLQKSGLAPSTVQGYRACILAVIHHVTRVPTLGPHVKKIKRTLPKPTCWTREELLKLVQTAQDLEGTICDEMTWSDWWLSMIHAGYSTGQRLGDLLTVPMIDVLPDGRCYIVQRKTKQTMVVQFSSETMKSTGRFPRNRNLFLPWKYSIEIFRKRFKALIQKAEIRPGSFKWLRRCAGSHLEAVMPGAGHRLLGNTRQVFEAHYNDLSVSVSEPLQAPSLDD